MKKSAIVRGEESVDKAVASMSEGITVLDDVDEELLPLFLEEANELYPKISSVLRAWREQSGSAIRLGDKLQRSLHTLKGSARMAGAMRLGELTHQAEGRIDAAITLACFDDALWNELENYLGRIGNAIESLSKTGAALTEAPARREWQQEAMACKVPLASVSERLYRVVRNTAKELGKKANLELLGSELELDRGVLEKMTAPLEHLLRNAIAHGLETPEQRELLGKAGIGEIRLSLRHENNEMVFELSDDGSGLDMVRLRHKAVQNGVLHEGEELGEARAIQMIFEPGLSTAREITEISGRGIGLDVVSTEVSALGGSVDVVSMPGKGARFTIHLPLICPSLS